MVATACPASEATKIPNTYTLPLSLVPELNREMEQLWLLSVEDANNCVNINTLTDRYRQAYLAYSVRLIALLQAKHADYRISALAEDKSVTAFRDALVDKTTVTISHRTEVHRGPYVPGGSYTETVGEYVLEDETVLVDLSELNYEHIPVTIEATDTNYGASLVFRLAQVNLDGDSPFAEYSVSIDD